MLSDRTASVFLVCLYGNFFVFFYTVIGHKYKWVVFGTRNSSKHIFASGRLVFMCKRRYIQICSKVTDELMNVISQIVFFLKSTFDKSKKLLFYSRKTTPKAPLKTRLNAFTIQVNPVIIIWFSLCRWTLKFKPQSTIQQSLKGTYQQIWIPFHQEWFVPSLVEIYLVVLKKKISFSLKCSECDFTIPEFSFLVKGCDLHIMSQVSLKSLSIGVSWEGDF